ncbi:sugar ABC transporter permease [Hamadaea tsunoensis]|uniref:sugar ABC transporter permease n=1 Tax=Hamadaea tsunoensis TaxID=53368 RepID=UPI000428B8B7|nr:sugar ABC transporter permease [Hamadaea tsunoensis]
MSTLRNNRILFGLLATVPALLLLCSGYVVPTVQTLYASFTDASLLRDGTKSVGLNNYDAVLRAFGDGLTLDLRLVVGVLAIALLLGGGLGFLAHKAGRWGRRLVYAVFALPLAAALAPFVQAMSWVGGPVEDLRMRPVEQMLIAGFGALVALGAITVMLAARGGLGAILVAAGTLAGSLVAVASQAFSFAVLGIPTGLPALTIYTFAFRTGRLGVASAASVLLLIPLMVLGIGVTLLLILTRTRIAPAAQAPAAQAPAAQTGGWLGGTGAAVVVLGLASLAGLVVWLPRLVEFGDPGNLGTHLANTWLPPLVSTVVGICAAALAGFGIGGLRPFGDRSELLLLPFAPWLFVGLAPLMTAYWDHSLLRDAPAFFRLLTPGSLVIPVLVGSTLLFRGLAELPAAKVFAIAGPLLGAAAYVVWVLRAQQPLWALLTVNEPAQQTMPVSAFTRMFAYGTRTGTGTAGWVYPLPIYLISAAVIAVVLILVVDRLTVRTGRAPARPIESEGDQV